MTKQKSQKEVVSARAIGYEKENKQVGKERMKGWGIRA
jgi:hypothetical protein